MLNFIKEWFTPPVFPGDEEKTIRARLLNGVISGVIGFICLVILGNLLGGQTPINVMAIDVGLLVAVLVCRRWLISGHLTRSGLGMLAAGFISITAINAGLGTIRTPSASLYLFLVLMAGAIFELPGTVISAAFSSLAVLALILAENGGLLPAPNYAVTITQWITYSCLFVITGGLSYYIYQLTKEALVRATHENQMREALAGDMRKLTRAVEQSPASIVITNLDGNIEYVNPRFTQVTGYTFDEAIGQNPRILKTDLTLAGTHRHLWDTLTAGQEWRGEFTNRRKDGSIYYEAATISPITDANGVTTHYLAVKEDITARKNSEKALRDSEVRFRMMFENHRAAMLLIDPQTGDILDANTSAQIFYGYDLETFKTLSINGIDTQPKDVIASALQRAAGGETNLFVFPHRLASGEVRTVEIHSSPILFNEKIALFSIIHDITDRQRLETTLRESEARWQFALEGAGDGVWDWNCQTGQVFYSHQWKAMLGYDDAEIGNTQEEWRKRIHPEDVAAGIGSGRHLAAQDEVFTNEYRLLCKDGKYKWIMDRGKVIEWSEDHKPLRVIGTHTDITERKRSEAVLQLRLELMEYSTGHALGELLQQALDKVCALTESPIGFYHFVDEDQKTLTLQAWSTRTLQEYCRAEAAGMHYNLDAAGVWVDCVYQNRPVIHNDYASLPHRKGLPEGHAPLVREMVVPVYRDTRVVAILGVGNKAQDYTETDLASVFYFADLVWEIAERKLAEEALSKSEARSRALFEQSHDAVFILNLQGQHLAANQRAAEMLGYTLEELKNLSVNDTSAELEKSHSVMQRLLSGEQFPIYERVFRRKDGSLFPAEVNLELVRDKNGVPFHIQSVVRDISQRKQAEDALRQANEQLNLRMDEVEELQAELREQALHDPLTGLYNRRYLGDALEREIVRAGREGKPVSIIVSDVDFFKHVNDALGHHAGDRALMQIAGLMTKSARGSDFACRYGGEEFLLVMPGASLQAAASRAEEIRGKCADMLIEFEGKSVQITMSFGVASYPSSGPDGDQVIIHADKALYLSKSNGRNQVTVWGEHPAIHSSQ